MMDVSIIKMQITTISTVSIALLPKVTMGQGILEALYLQHHVDS